MDQKSKPTYKKQKPTPTPTDNKPMNQKRKSCENKGGSVLSDMSKLAVPFGLIAAKNSLEKFIANRKVEEMKKEKAKTAFSSKPKSKKSNKSKSKPKA